MALFLGRDRRRPSRAEPRSATERTTSGGATDERTRTPRPVTGVRRWPRLVLSVWRWLLWPARIVWAGAGLVARALSVVGRGVRWLVRQVAPFADAPLAVALFLYVALGPPGTPYRPPSVIDTVLIGTQLLPLAVLRRRPVAAWALMAVGNLLGLLVIDYYPIASLAVLIGAVAVVAHREDRTTATRTGALTSVALLPALWHPTFQPVTAAFWLIAVLVALVFGDNLRLRREAESGLAAAREERELERRRRALLEERSRIARELHDVVAHHMSLIAVQSQSAPRRIPGLPAEGVADFEQINTAARSALNEMRRVLTVLRDDRDPPDRVPQPGVAALEHLVTGAGQAGQDVTLRVRGEARPLRDAVDLSVYRIVQEALTNVRRHAGPSAAIVTIEYLPAAVRVQVADRGVGDRSTPGHGGQGLVGMRERVAMLGGELSTGDRDGGGFEVTATLPYDDGSRP